MTEQMEEVKKIELESLELKISRFLRWGVLLSGSLMLIGWTIELFHQSPGDPFLRFRQYEVIPLSVQLARVWSERAVGTMLSYAGLFILIGLPITRVALTAILFLKQKEHILAAIALLVLLCLAFSFTQGIEF